MAKTGQVEKLVEAPSTSAKWHQVIKTLSFIFKTSAVRPWRTQEKIKGKRKLVRYIFFGGISYLRLLVIWAIFSKKRNSLELFFFNSMRCSRQSFSCLLIMCFDFFPCLRYLNTKWRWEFTTVLHTFDCVSGLHIFQELSLTPEYSDDSILIRKRCSFSSGNTSIKKCAWI